MRRAALLAFLISVLPSASTFAQEDELSNLPEMKRAPVRGGELEYEVRGDGEPVLLIHGALITDSFLPLMDEPSLGHYRLIRYRRRGYVGSTPAEGSFSIRDEAEDALALLKHLGHERAHIVGHSSGGVIALQIALDDPDVVHSLVLLEPALQSEVTGVAERVAPLVEQFERGDAAGAVDAFIGEPDWRADVSRTVPGGPEQAERDAGTFFKVEIPAILQWEFGPDEAVRISQPMRILHNPDWTKRKPFVQEWFSGVEYHVVENVNHLLPMQDPRAVAEGIEDFLNRHPF